MELIILSRNINLYSTKRLIEAAKFRGHHVKVIDHQKCFVGIEAGCPAVYYGGESLKNVDAIIPRIGASVTFYGTAVVRQFEMMRTVTLNKSAAITRSRDKLKTLQSLLEAGLGIPKTVFANKPKDIDKLIQYVGGAPVIIKLLEGTQGIGVVLVDTLKAAKSVIEAFYGLNANILIQEFIREADSADIRAFVVDGEVVGAIKRQGADGEFRSNLHRGGKGTIIELTEEEKHAAILAAEKLELGVAGVDMLRSHKGPLIIEVNSSPGLQGIETYTGIDVAGKIIEYAEREVEKVHAGVS